MRRLKFWFAGMLFASMVAVTVVKVNLNYGATAGSRDFILHNVEALAQNENGENDCWGTGNLICGDGLYKARITR